MMLEGQGEEKGKRIGKYAVDVSRGRGGGELWMQWEKRKRWTLPKVHFYLIHSQEWAMTYPTVEILEH